MLLQLQVKLMSLFAFNMYISRNLASIHLLDNIEALLLKISQSKFLKEFFTAFVDGNNSLFNLKYVVDECFLTLD